MHVSSKAGTTGVIMWNQAEPTDNSSVTQRSMALVVQLSQIKDFLLCKAGTLHRQTCVAYYYYQNNQMYQCSG